MSQPKFYTITLRLVGNGTITTTPTGPYVAGQSITLTAQATAGWTFTGWSGAISGVDNPKHTTITASVTVTATFAELSPQQPYTLTVHTSGNGKIQVTPDGPYADGQVITVTVTPEPGWYFDHWSSDLAGANPSVTFSITKNTVVTAIFSTRRVYMPTVLNESEKQ